MSEINHLINVFNYPLCKFTHLVFMFSQKKLRKKITRSFKWITAIELNFVKTTEEVIPIFWQDRNNQSPPINLPFRPLFVNRCNNYKYLDHIIESRFLYNKTGNSYQAHITVFQMKIYLIAFLWCSVTGLFDFLSWVKSKNFAESSIEIWRNIKSVKPCSSLKKLQHTTSTAVVVFFNSQVNSS